MKKSQILGLASEPSTQDNIEHSKIEEVEQNDKNKSLDEYEKELLKQSVIEDKAEQKSVTQTNDDYYQREKLKEKAKLDAKEEIRSKRRAEQKVVVDKGVNKIKRIIKWIIAFILWIFAIACFSIIGSNGMVYLPLGLLVLILGVMSCPKITDITQKYETYTKHKTIIVWILVIILFVIMVAFPTNNSNGENTNEISNQANTIENN